jgi:ATP synthase protein I
MSDSKKDSSDQDQQDQKDEQGQQDWRAALWKGAMVPSLITALVALGAGFLFEGLPGFWGSALGAFTVVIFFSVHLFIARLSRSLDPTSTMIVAMLSYMLKISAMAVFLLLVTRLTDPEDIHRPTFAIASLALTAAWLGGEIRAFMKIRLTLDV